MRNEQPGKISELRSGAHVHLMGICGVAMASLAGLLKAKGFQVTGSDQNVYPPMSTQVEALGIAIQNGYRAENLSPKPDFVVVGNVISANNPEAQELSRLGVPFTSLAAAMGELVIGPRHSVVVAGTHGKTTSTALAAFVWSELGLSPGFLVGGVPKNFPVSYALPQGDWFVIEGDEYDTAYFDKGPKFLHYRPQSVILTSVEFDHADIYKDLSAVMASFAKLLGIIPIGGKLAIAADDPRIAELASQTRVRERGVRVLSFGQGGDLEAREVQVLKAGTRFEVRYPDSAAVTVTTQLMGAYNVKNILGVMAIAELQGFDRGRVAQAISGFAGVRRRQELLGEISGRRVFEDFAHHPTAVRLTLDLLSERRHGGRVLAVFEPRSATSRRRVFQAEYAHAFGKADGVFLAQPFNQSALPEHDRFSSDELATDLRAKGVDARVFSTTDEIAIALAEASRPGDIIVVMSNGGFDGIYDKIMSRLAQV